MEQLIEAIDFPSVITAAHIDHLRQESASAARADFMRGYLGADDYARVALETLVQALAHHDSAGAFFLNGAFGAGKSHLLGIITLLAEGKGHAEFASLYPALAASLQQLPRRFVVYFSLDNYDGSKLALEEIVEREITRQAAAQGMEINAFRSEASVSRSEKFAALQEELQAHHYDGLQLCIDELSLFLGSKDHIALQRAASWLQFLGQRCARHLAGQHFSYRCCLVLQKSWEDIGDLEPYSLSQIRDRYHTLTLSIAHLPQLVQHRLLRRRVPDAIRALCDSSFKQLLATHPQLDFGISEWESLYPFHPSAIQLLSELSSRFFSRTRSAVLFCAQALKRYLQRADANTRITAAEVFDYFQPEFAQYAELRPLDRVWQFWKASLTRIARDETERETYMVLLKSVLLFRLSGRPVTAFMVGNTIYGNALFEGEENYRYFHQLLTRWCEDCDHLVCEKGEDWRSDQFIVDLGQSVKNAVRRLARERRESLGHNDARVLTHLLEQCHSDLFPVQKLLAGSISFTVDWHHSPRAIEIALWQNDTPHILINQLSINAQHHPKVLLYLALPDREIAMPALGELQTRLRAALLLWQPRPLTGDEWEFARESAARMLLRQDPVLRDNRRGRSMLKYLESDLKQREKDIRQLMLRIYAEGTLLCGDQRSVEVAELCHQRQWNAMIPPIAAFALQELYAQYARVAPVVKVLSRPHVNQMQEKLLHQNSADKWWPASMERPVRSVAAPLGLVGDDKGRRRFSEGNAELIQTIETLIDAQAVPVTKLIQELEISEWGLMPMQSELVLCGMLGAGKLEAIDAKGKVLLAASLRPPLQKSVYALRRAALVSEEAWQAIALIINSIDEGLATPRTFAAQAAVAMRWRTWTEEMRSELELANARLHQLKNALGDAAGQWNKTTHLLNALSGIIEISDTTENNRLLEEIAKIDIEQWRRYLMQWRYLNQRLDHSLQQIILLLKRINNRQLTVSAPLAETTATLRQRFLEGEKVLFDETLLEDARQWNSAVEAEYDEWHAAQYAQEKWQQLRALSADPTLAALAELAAIDRYPFREDTVLLSKIRELLRRQCPRDGKLLPGEIVCGHCHIAYGEKVLLPDMAKIENAIDAAIKRFYDLIHSAELSTYLQRSEIGNNLLQWDGNKTTFAALLNDAVVATLEKALAPRRQFTRSAKTLLQQLAAGGSRSQIEAIFQRWIEDGVAVGGDDEIRISDLPQER